MEAGKYIYVSKSWFARNLLLFPDHGPNHPDKVQKEEQEVTFPLPGSNPPVDKPLVFPYFEILLFSPGLLSKPRGAISAH